MYKFASAILTCAMLTTLPVCIGAAQASSAKAVAADRDPLSYRKLEWIAMVRERDFARLTRLLEAAQKKYETGKITSFEVDTVYSKFDFADLQLQKNFNDWVEAYPAAAPPLIARGNFLAHLGLTVWRSIVGPIPAPAGQTVNKLLGQAIRDYFSAIAIRQKSVTAHVQLIKLYTEFNPHEFVRREYEEAIRSVPEASAVHFRYAVSLHPDFRHGRTAEEKTQILQDYADFIQQAEELTATDPNYKSVVRFAKGMIASQAYADDKFEMAEALYSEILENKDTPYYRVKRASLRAYLKRYDQADADIRKAIALDPDFIYSYRAAWDFEVRRKNFQQAERYIETALALDPFDPALLRRRATAYSQSGQNDVAIKTLQKALVLGNWSGEVYSRLGIAYHNIRNWKKANKYFKTAFLLKPWDTILMGNLMDSLIRVKDCMFFDLVPTYMERCSKSERCQNNGFSEVLKPILKYSKLEKICRRTAPWNEKPKPNSF